VTEPSRSQYGVTLARNLGMAARDGTWLATDVWRPAQAGEPLPGPFPAVLVRTPYDRRGSRYERHGEFWAERGYLFVIQDVRGRFDSEGEFVLLADEGPDGFDAVEWAAALPYCDGNVGTFGTSYSGWTQSAAALERPPHLKAMWVNQGGSNGNVTALRHNGALELRWLTWAVSHGAVSPEANRDPVLARELQLNTEHMYEWLQRLPWHEGNSPLPNLPGYEQWARDLYEHGDADDYWQQRGLNFEAHLDQSADVPTVYSSGWYDSYTRATTDLYVAAEERFAGQQLLMGPWTHGEVPLDRTYSGEVDLGPDAPIHTDTADGVKNVHLEFFDHHLRGVNNGIDASPVRIFVMGGGSGTPDATGRLDHGGSWRNEQEWPLARAVPTPFYLHPGGGLVEGEAPSADGGASTFRYDPANPLPTISANTSSLNEIAPQPERTTLATPIVLMRVMVIQGGADQRTRPDLHGCEAPYGPLEDRPDVLSFSSQPLADDMEVTGPIEATIYLESDVPDTDLFVMVQDVYPPSGEWPDGYRLNAADGLMRVRYRGGMTSPELMTPGEPVEVTFQLYPTSNRFVAGHRIQVLVSSSSFPRFDPNPNTGEPIGRHTHTQIANNRIFHAGERASRVVLPLVPAGS